MITLYVTYAGDASTRFDREYWLEVHFPLVRACWERYGLKSIAGFFPERNGAGLVAICPCVFDDEAAMKAALAAPETRRVMEDVRAFTDVEPQHSLGTPL